MSFDSLPTDLAAQIDRAAAAAPAEAEQVAVQLDISATGRVALTPIGPSDTTPTWTSR